MYDNVEDDVFEVAAAAIHSNNATILGSMLIFFEICALAFLSWYTYTNIGSNIYLEVAKVFVCVAFVIGLIKLLFKFMKICLKRENEDNERWKNQDHYRKVELILWSFYFIIFGLIGAFSLNSYFHPFMALGIEKSSHQCIAWVCGALFALGCLKLFLDYLIEHKSNLLPLPSDHLARKNLERRRQVCEDVVNWFLFFIMIAFFGLVSRNNTMNLAASGNYPSTSLASACLTKLFIVLFLGGLYLIFWGVIGKRVLWRDEEHRPPWFLKWLISKRLENTVTYIITPLQIYAYRPLPKRPKRLRKTSKRLSTISEAVEMKRTNTRRRGGLVVKTFRVQATVEGEPSTSQPKEQVASTSQGSPQTPKKKMHQKWKKQDRKVGPTG